MRFRTPTSMAMIALLAQLGGCEKSAPQPAEPTAEPAKPQVQAALLPEGWVLFAPDGQGFRVAMPTEPKSRQEQRKNENGTVTITTWLAITPTGAAYSVGVTEMPAAIAEVLTPKAEFDDTRNKLLVKVEGKLVDEENAQLAGHPSRTFSLLGKGPEGETVFRLRLVRAGNRTFQLMSAHAKSDDHPADAQHFFTSFGLTEAGSPR